MPAKPRRHKGKHPHHSKKSKAMMRQATPQPQTQPQETAAAPKPAVEPVVVTTETKPVRTPEAAVLRYPYVTEELKRIGILAGIIIVVLIVLSIVL